MKLWWTCKTVKHDYVLGAVRAVPTAAGARQDKLYDNDALLWTKLEPQFRLVWWCWWSNCWTAAFWWRLYYCLSWRRPTGQLVLLFQFICKQYSAISFYNMCIWIHFISHVFYFCFMCIYCLMMESADRYWCSINAVCLVLTLEF